MMMVITASEICSIARGSTLRKGTRYLCFLGSLEDALFARTFLAVADAQEDSTTCPVCSRSSPLMGLASWSSIQFARELWIVWVPTEYCAR